VKFDVVVIGAGAAGLAAARELSGSGKRVCLLEARPRLGGRIHTLHLAGLPLPIELGAEFIHGQPDETFSIVEAAALIACELPDNHWWSHNGKWDQISDFWERIQKITKPIGNLKRDVSFNDFLRSRRSLSPRQREEAISFAEGYHAAHADRISAMTLDSSDEEQDDDSGGNKQFRILNGYDAVIEWLRAGLHPERTEIRLETTVRQISWSDGEVTVDCLRGKREQTVRAAAAIVTVPIGVWKAAREQEGSIRFDPALDEKTRAIAKLEVGHVVKIMFRFRERFWEERDRDEPVAFIHSSDRFVPTWWTAAPVRSPILTAWAGGHAADALLAEGDEGMIDRVLDSMSKAFTQRRRTIDDLLAGAYSHNWQSDPFSRGAYSYAGVGGSGAHKTLSRPIGATLFFAGEATNAEQTGTVAGAIESGRRAATELLGG
jgi:monoamine oxidase